MNRVALQEEPYRENLFPFTHTRSIADIRIGILTIREKWEQFFNYRVETGQERKASSIPIPANLIPNALLIQMIERGSPGDIQELSAEQVRRIEYPWDIFQGNDGEIRKDFEWLTRNRQSEALPASNRLIGTGGSLFIEPGARVQHALINTSTGPVYIGRNAEIMEGAMIRGPFALCEGATVKMGTVIYGATTIGPYSVVGGEIKNSVIFGYSNKAHSGYLGDSVIGAWCNLGAGTSNSNLKNNLGRIRIWNESTGTMIEAGQKCGLFMGDYSRSAINTSFNSGTVVGVCCNVFGPGLMPKHIPHFSWGHHENYELQRALEDIRAWQKLKNHSLSDAEIRTLTHIFEKN
jgi:UDP-N-acetylglucosamine diphosphorylase/glucosamine-1-phosphate N-acetyltransferase